MVKRRNMFETTTRIICVCFFLNPTAVVPLILLPTICNKIRFMFSAELRRRLTIDNLYNPHLLERAARETVFFCFSSAHVQRVLSLWGLGKIRPIGKHDVTSRILLLRELSNPSGGWKISSSNWIISSKDPGNKIKQKKTLKPPGYYRQLALFWKAYLLKKKVSILVGS